MTALAWLIGAVGSVALVVGVRVLTLRLETLDQARGWIVVLTYLLAIAVLASFFGWPTHGYD